MPTAMPRFRLRKLPVNVRSTRLFRALTQNCLPRVIRITVLGWALMLPPSTWHWKGCAIDWHYDAPVEKWGRTSDVFATRGECEARYAEMAQRETSHRDRAIAQAKEREAHDDFLTKLLAPLSDPTTSALCMAMSDQWTHMRCREVIGSSTTLAPENQ